MKIVGRTSLWVVVLWLSSCASTGQAPFDPLGEKFRHRVAFETGQAEAVAGNEITIEEVWGTRPSVEVGGSYIVTGHYKLAAASQGEVVFWQTAKNWDNSGPTIDTQRMPVRQGEGRFALLHEMPGPGYFHIVLRADDGRELANVYFGHGESLLEAE